MRSPLPCNARCTTVVPAPATPTTENAESPVPLVPLDCSTNAIADASSAGVILSAPSVIVMIFVTGPKPDPFPAALLSYLCHFNSPKKVYYFYLSFFKIVVTY